VRVRREGECREKTAKRTIQLRGEEAQNNGLSDHFVTEPEPLLTRRRRQRSSEARSRGVSLFRTITTHGPTLIRQTTNTQTRGTKPMVYYFGYGSNIWIDQMNRRCPDNKYIGLGLLRGW